MNNPKSGIGQVTDLAQAACRSQTQPRIYGTGRSARCSESDILQDALVQCEKKIRINSVGVCRFESGSPEYVCVCVRTAWILVLTYCKHLTAGTSSRLSNPCNVLTKQVDVQQHLSSDLISRKPR